MLNLLNKMIKLFHIKDINIFKIKLKKLKIKIKKCQESYKKNY